MAFDDYLELIVWLMIFTAFTVTCFMYRDVLEIQASNQMLLYGSSASNVVVGGYYDPNGKFYCVNAKQRAKEVIYTDYHEFCHYSVDEDEKHFCGGKLQWEN